MKKIVIMTHAGLAQGAKETVQFLAGNCELTAVSCFTEEMHPDHYIETLLQNKKPEETLIILTDLKGGSVNQKVAQHCLQHDFYLITGFNLALLLELTVVDEAMINPAYLREIVEKSKQEIVLINDALQDLPANEDFDFFEA